MNLQNWVGIEIGPIYEISLNIFQSSFVTNEFLLKWRKFHEGYLSGKSHGIYIKLNRSNSLPPKLKFRNDM